MERDRILQALNTTLQSGAAEQKAASEYLDQCTRVGGFCTELLRIVVDDAVPENIRLAAVIFLKNTMNRHWTVDEDEEEESKKRKEAELVPEGDRLFVRENLMDAICRASAPLRVHLCTALQTAARADFPARWPGLANKIAQLLHSDDGTSWLGALTVIYKISKMYEYKRAKERTPLVELLRPMLPLIAARFQQLLQNDAPEAMLLQLVSLKIIYCLTQFSLDLNVMDLASLDGWLECARLTVLRPLPPDFQLGEEPADSVFWKSKKWAAKLLDRVFERYGAPGQVESAYAEFAVHFLHTFAVPCTEAFLQILAHRNQGMYVSNRVSHLALSFLGTGISHAHTWKAIKPHFNELVQKIIFPFLCHTQEDEEMWEDNVEEFIRAKYDIFDDMYSPSNSAASLLSAGCKRKDVMQPVLAFCIEHLKKEGDPIGVDGALHMAGELSSQLCTSKKYKKDVEKLLDAHIISHLSSQSRFVRARAAWCIKAFSSTQFHSPRILKAAVAGVTQRLVAENEELPVKVEAALAIQHLLDDQEDKATELIRPHIADVIRGVLQLVASTQIEEMCGVMDELIDKFLDDIVPIAAQVAEQLSNMFLAVLGSEDADERTPTLMSVVSTLANILDVVEEEKEIMMAVEISVLRIIHAVFTTGNVDYYDDILLLIQSLITSYISESMWEVFLQVYKTFCDESNALLLFADVMPVLHLYLTVDTEAFLARPERLNAVLHMCTTVLKDPEQGDDNQLSAAKLLECLLLQCGHGVAEAVPLAITLALHRLAQPFLGLSELKPMLILVLVAALYTNEATALQVLSGMAPPTGGRPLDIIAEQLCELSEHFDGIHARKVAVIGWCILLRMQAAIRPSVIAYQPKRIIESCIKIFEGLEKALKVQAENRALEEGESSDEEEDDDEDGETPVGSGKKKRHPRHRTINDDLADSEDEIDEGTLEYLETLQKKNAVGHGDNNDSDDEDESEDFIEETDTEAYETPLEAEDAPDVFVLFKETMEGFEQAEQALFALMVNTLDETAAGKLRQLITVCAQHAQLADSKKIEQTGGYNFNANAQVPTNFNFGQ